VPRFSRIYADLGADRIPAASRVLMHVGQFIDKHRPIWRVVWLAVRFFWCTQYVIRHFERDSSLDVVGAVHWHPTAPLSTRRFSHTLAMFVATDGVPFVNSPRHGGRTFAAPEPARQLTAASAPLARDNPFRAALPDTGLATEIGVRMLAAGERTGNMAEMMDHVARLYDEELGEWIERFTRLFEPLLMTALA